MCAFEIVWQVHIHVEIGDGMLVATRPVPDTNRMADILNAHLVNGNFAGVFRVLYVSDRVTGVTGITGVSHISSFLISFESLGVRG